MKFLIIFILIGFQALTVSAQVDTIYTNTEKIPCSVKEITTDAVKFTYAGEDLLNSIYKNAILKIQFKSGRMQVFAESTSFKKLKDLADFENVTISQVESEVKGLFKLGDVSAKAKGTTTLSNQERVKERAYRKIKIQAALMGANVIYLTNQRQEGNKMGGYYQTGSTNETSLSGIAYTNVLPDFKEFIKAIKTKRNFEADYEDKLNSGASDMTTTTTTAKFEIYEINDENGLIILSGNLEDTRSLSNKYRVVSFDSTKFNITYESKNSVYNLTIPFNHNKK